MARLVVFDLLATLGVDVDERMQRGVVDSLAAAWRDVQGGDNAQSLGTAIAVTILLLIQPE